MLSRLPRPSRSAPPGLAVDPAGVAVARHPVGAAVARHPAGAAPNLRLIVAAGVIVTSLATGRPARADFELGGFVGAHLFAADNQLGRQESGPDGIGPEHMATL